MARRSVLAVPVVAEYQPPPMLTIKGAVMAKDWNNWALNGGILQVYPVRKGGELPGMIVVALVEQTTKIVNDTTPKRTRG